MKPNLFEIATKELSQDAFIVWFLSYADSSCSKIDYRLNKCAIDFVSKLIRNSFPHFNDEIKKVEAGRQWEDIDVWAEINDKYLIIIEDKTNTGKHGNQLERYKQTASEYCRKKNYEKPICIYSKTGNESQKDINEIIKEGYSIFNRKDFLDLFNIHPDITNDIFLDFKINLERKENSNSEFINKKIGDWVSHDYVGFYQSLENEMKILNWHKVNNPGGGFWNALLSWDYYGDYPTYLQIEEKKLCFKISTHIDDLEFPMTEDRGNVRNRISEFILTKAEKEKYFEIKKPTRFGNGVWMTVAVVQSEFWLGKPDELVDLNQVVKNLSKYLKFIKEKICTK